MPPHFHSRRRRSTLSLAWTLAFAVVSLAANAATVLLPDGRTATGARAVSLATGGYTIVTGTEFADPLKPATLSEDGALDVRPKTAGRWVILHPAGWADVEISPETAEVKLEPWNEVPGFIDAPLPPNATISYHRTEPLPRREDKGIMHWMATTPIASDGTFTLKHAPTGEGTVGLLREAKRGSRFIRWRECPRVFHAPLGGPLIIAGGTTISGRVMDGPFPAILSLVPKSPGPTHNGLF